jgi:hypothetical protein
MKFLVNPYFIFRILSYILAVFIGIDLFNEKITFTDGDNEKDFTDEKKIDKGKQIATEMDSDHGSDSKSETKSSQVTEQEVKETKKSYKDLSYAEKMLALMQNMMDHDEEVNKLRNEEEDKGTEGLINQEDMVETLVENRINDTKSIIELTKALNQTNIDEDLSTVNKRSLNEEDLPENDENLSEPQEVKKFKSTDKDIDIKDNKKQDSSKTN